MTQVVSSPPLCQSVLCRHTIAMHGERAGSLPGHCLHPDCRCPAWNPPTIPTQAPRLSNPRHDRDLYLAWRHALDVAAEIGDPETGYEIMMGEIERWQRRAFGLPPASTPPPALS